MIGLWMAYAVLVALLLGGAAAIVERMLRLQSRSARGVWVAALAGSWGLPLMMWLRPREAAGPAPAPVPEAATGIDPALLLHLLDGAAALPATPLPWLEPLSEVLLAGWVALAVGGISLFGLAVWAVARRSHRWPRRKVLGESVRVSPDFGPAVVGLRNPEIVLPRWVLELGLTGRHLVLRHEREHREARDTLLLAAGTVATLAAPWNPALWWQLRRLRLAVELDCDARVLRTGVSPRRYGDLLLSVGERMGRSVMPMAALAEPPSFLERRLKMISERRRNGATWKVAVGLVTAGALVGVACETPTPTLADEEVGTMEAVEAVQERPAPERAGTLELRERPARAEDVGEEEEGNAEVLGTLRGRVNGARVLAGERPGSGGTVRLRGRQDISSESPPLMVIDGVIQAPDAQDLEALDIESIEVLKGAAAAELYGERGANGVIQITTKRDEGPPPANEGAAVTEFEVEEFDAVGTFRVREVSWTEETPSIPRRALEVAERGLRSAWGLIAKPLRSRTSPSEEPLVVVDGEVWSRARLESVDRDRIDRIEIVKGAAAAELYGERGANGVIQVYLKKR